MLATLKTSIRLNFNDEINVYLGYEESFLYLLNNLSHYKIVKTQYKQ